MKPRRDYLDLLLSFKIVKNQISSHDNQLMTIFKQRKEIIQIYRKYRFKNNYLEGILEKNSTINKERDDHNQFEKSNLIDNELPTDQNERAYTPEEIKKIELVEKLKVLEKKNLTQKNEKLDKISKITNIKKNKLSRIMRILCAEYCMNPISSEEKQKLKKDIEEDLIEKNLIHLKKELKNKIDFCKTERDIIDFLLTYNVSSSNIGDRVSVDRMSIKLYDSYVFFRKRKKEELHLFSKYNEERKKEIIKLQTEGKKWEEIERILIKKNYTPIKRAQIYNILAINKKKEQGIETITKKVKTNEEQALI